MSENTGGNFCAGCGVVLKPGARFCGSCGKTVSAGTSRTDAVVAPATPVSMSPAAQPQYSADQKWWWDGSQWNVVPNEAVAAVTPIETSAPVATVVPQGMVSASGSGIKRHSPRRRNILIGIGVVLVVSVGLLFVASKAPTPSQGGFGLGAGPYYEHFNCQGASSCMADASNNEAYANNGNTGISYDYLAMIVCQQIANVDSAKGQKTWCSTSKNPGDTGP